MSPHHLRLVEIPGEPQWLVPLLQENLAFPSFIESNRGAQNCRLDNKEALERYRPYFGKMVLLTKGRIDQAAELGDGRR
jgi:hypothetical protein